MTNQQIHDRAQAAADALLAKWAEELVPALSFPPAVDEAEEAGGRLTTRQTFSIEESHFERAQEAVTEFLDVATFPPFYPSGEAFTLRALGFRFTGSRGELGADGEWTTDPAQTVAVTFRVTPKDGSEEFELPRTFEVVGR